MGTNPDLQNSYLYKEIVFNYTPSKSSFSVNWALFMKNCHAVLLLNSTVSKESVCTFLIIAKFADTCSHCSTRYYDKAPKACCNVLVR